MCSWCSFINYIHISWLPFESYFRSVQTLHDAFGTVKCFCSVSELIEEPLSIAAYSTDITLSTEMIPMCADAKLEACVSWRGESVDPSLQFQREARADKRELEQKTAVFRDLEYWKTYTIKAMIKCHDEGLRFFQRDVSIVPSGRNKLMDLASYIYIYIYIPEWGYSIWCRSQFEDAVKFQLFLFYWPPIVYSLYTSCFSLWG